MSQAAFKDAYDLLCGNKLGQGISRMVFECRLIPDCVVKVEIDEDWRDFANVREMRFFNENEYVKSIRDWLAPCRYLSPDGRILIQERVRPAQAKTDRLPKTVPSFLTDLKPENFGYLPNGRFVCCDYAIVINNPSTRLKKANW